VRNWLWASRSLAGALGEDSAPTFLVFDSKREKLHVGHSPVGFGADHEVQIILLRANIAISRGHGDLAKDSLDHRDPFYAIALADCNDSVCLLDRQGLYPILESDSRLAADLGDDKLAYLARSSPGIARNALAEAMLNRRVPITAQSFFRGAVRVSHCKFSPDSIGEEWS
jgi:hypothetical protein